MYMYNTQMKIIHVGECLLVQYIYIISLFVRNIDKIKQIHINAVGRKITR